MYLPLTVHPEGFMKEDNKMLDSQGVYQRKTLVSPDSCIFSDIEKP